MSRATCLDLLRTLQPDSRFLNVCRRLREQDGMLQVARRERRRLLDLCRQEKALWKSGLQVVVGADEVGRGPMAGPLVAAAVAFAAPPWIPGLNDSKQLTPEQREAMVPWVCCQALAVQIEMIPVAEVSAGNLHELSLRAMSRAVLGLGVGVQHILVDGCFRLPLELPQTALIKGDSKSVSIAAASVVAKVARDRYMIEQDQVYPGYGFAQHKGYNTAEHLEALRRLGPCPIHRTNFAPVRRLYTQQLTLGL